MTSTILTVRQQQVLDFVKASIVRTGAPPTRGEISKEFGFRSNNSAEIHLRALSVKGVIELIGGSSRGIRVNANLLQEINQIRTEQNAQEIPERKIAIPLIGRVAAGIPILAMENIERFYHIESRFFQQKPDYLLKVCGMSMRDAGIIDGDLLAIKSTKDVKNGQIVVARFNDEVTVKRFHCVGDQIQLHPENKEFQIIFVASGDCFEIDGLAVGLIRNTINGELH